MRAGEFAEFGFASIGLGIGFPLLIDYRILHCVKLFLLFRRCCDCLAHAHTLFGHPVIVKRQNNYFTAFKAWAKEQVAMADAATVVRGWDGR